MSWLNEVERAAARLHWHPRREQPTKGMIPMDVEPPRPVSAEEVDRLRDDLDDLGGYVEAVCEDGHRVLIDDGDGGVYGCPICLGEEWMRKANAENWERIGLLADLERLYRDWETRTGKHAAASDLRRLVASARQSPRTGRRA